MTNLHMWRIVWLIPDKYGIVWRGPIKDDPKPRLEGIIRTGEYA